MRAGRRTVPATGRHCSMGGKWSCKGKSIADVKLAPFVLAFFYPLKRRNEAIQELYGIIRLFDSGAELRNSRNF